MSETDITRSIREALTRIGVWVIRVQSGTIPALYGATRRYIHCAEPGTPDLCLPAFGAWLEVKTEAGALNPQQVAWHRRATREGVRVAVVRSPQEAVRVVREWQAESERLRVTG